MVDDDLDFDFEGTLAREAETYQGASVSFDRACAWGHGGRAFLPFRRRSLAALTPQSPSHPHVRPAPAAPSPLSRPALSWASP